MKKRYDHKPAFGNCPWEDAFTRRKFLKGCAYFAAGLGAYTLTGGMERVLALEKAPPEVTATKASSVAVIKTTNHALVAESWKDPFEMWPKGEPPNKLWQPSWTKESQVKIEEMVRQAVDEAGDWPIEKGDVVAIQANLVCSPTLFLQIGRVSDADLQCSVTDARVVRAVAILAKESGAKQIYLVANPLVADGYMNLRQWGYGKVASEIGAELVGLSQVPYKYYKAPFSLAYEEYALPTLMVDEVNKVISVAALKTHAQTGVTLTLKNVGIGTPTGKVYGGPRVGLPHERLPEVITDVCSMVGIDYAIIDGIWGMEGYGPLAGVPVPTDLIIAGPDPVAVDGVGTEIMGFPKENFGTTRMAKAYGLGNYENTKITAVGDSFERMMKQFDPVPKKFRFPGAHGDVYGWGGLEEKT
jgi:uncharacterized protein (DUF362 family)